jgi:hypothetical protein
MRHLTAVAQRGSRAQAHLAAAAGELCPTPLEKPSAGSSPLEGSKQVLLTVLDRLVQITRPGPEKQPGLGKEFVRPTLLHRTAGRPPALSRARPELRPATARLRTLSRSRKGSGDTPVAVPLERRCRPARTSQARPVAALLCRLEWNASE